MSWSDQNFLIRLDKLVSIEPAFDFAIDCSNIKLSEVYGVASEPDFAQGIDVSRPGTLSKWHKFASLPWTNCVFDQPQTIRTQGQNFSIFDIQ